MSTAILESASLCFWSLDKDGKNNPPTVAATRDTLTANNLNPERAADIPETTAFRRACSAVKGEDITVRHFTRKTDDLPCVQFDREIQDEGRLRRQYIGTYALRDGVPTLEAGEPVDGMEDAYATATATYNWADLSQIVKAILNQDGMGAYSPKKNGGVYFVPVKPEAADLLERIERFASALSVRFLKFSIPDVQAQREEIADAIASSFMEEIGVHALAIAAYDDSTRPGMLANRREMIGATNASMMRLSHLINGRREDCQKRMRELLDQIKVIEGRISAKESQRQLQETQTNALEGGRRIVGVAS